MSSINAAMGSVSMGTSKSVTGSLYNATSTQNINTKSNVSNISIVVKFASAFESFLDVSDAIFPP